MVMMLTGRRPSRNGYSKTHPWLLGFNPTIASTLKEAGYTTYAVLDNGNLSPENGYGKGFEESYHTVFGARNEVEGARQITETGIQFLRGAKRPYFLWLHYVNPHAPYTPPPPFDTAFLDAKALSGPPLRIVEGFHGGIPKSLAVAGKNTLGYYVAQYDGEIATVDQEVGRVLEALRQSGAWDKTVIVLTSDHGESLGEHDYFFDHGEDLFDPCLRIPLLIAAPGVKRGQRSEVLASTLDVFPTILDAAKISYPEGLAGDSLLGVADGAAPREALRAERLEPGGHHR